MTRPSLVSARKLVAAAFMLAVAVAGFVVWRASHALRTASEQVRQEQQIHFAVRPLPPVLRSDFELVNSPALFSQAAQFQGHLYIAGPAGLLEYDPEGRLVREYAAGRDLPGSPLIALSPAALADARKPELVVATAEGGLLAFDGTSFREIVPLDANARAITAFLPVASGHLLIGTRKRGVLVYDGRQITAFHSSLENLYVTTLAGNESDLWVGTLDRGVLHYHAGESESFTEAQGVPDPQVLSLAIGEDVTYVGTPLGVAVFQAGRFVRVLAPGVFATALLENGDQLYVGSEDQGVISIPLTNRRRNPNAGPASQFRDVRQLFASGGDIIALARNGLYRLSPHAFAWQPLLQPGAAVLNDRNISALAVDSGRRLWVGYFDRGIDVLSPDNSYVRHLEDEHVFCVNRIFSDTRNGTINVATANGLVRLDSSGSEQQVLTRSDGLIADHVTDVVAYRDGLALATPAGLTFLDANGASSLYAFNGLVNNHVYALGVSGDQLLAGTLGGLSLLDKSNVAANYSTSTSGLKHNWVTAVVAVGTEWMVGTYGAGILGLDGSGHFHTFPTASDPFEVNPNAMLVTSGYVLAGTMGKGLYVYDRQAGRWTILDAGLPSLNVTALAAGNGFLYIGTDNGLVRVAEKKLHS